MKIEIKACFDGSVCGGGDHGKGVFAMLMTLCIELHDSANNLYLDEVIGVIESPQDKVEIIRPLAFKLSQGFLN